MSHTPEPWMVDPDDRPGYEWNNHIVSATDPNQTICFMTHDNTPENIEGEANARRIVACVNACKGIKTESLEMNVLSWITDETGENPLQRERDELLEARRACGERLIEVEQQRDELRAALIRAERKLSAYIGVCTGDKELTGTVLPMARDALAKVGAVSPAPTFSGRAANLAIDTLEQFHKYGYDREQCFDALCDLRTLMKPYNARIQGQAESGEAACSASPGMKS